MTGASGLLGRSVLRSVFEAGHEAVALSRSPQEVPGAEVVLWEATQDWELSAETLRRMEVEVVIHAAAHIPLNHGDVTEAERCLNVNALGTLVLLRAIEVTGVRRMLYVSGTNLLTPRSEFVREDDPVGCEHAPYYLGSKLLGEIYVRSAMARGMDGLIVRPSSIYGPGMVTGVIWKIADSLRAGSPIRLDDGGRFRADYLWRDDVAAVLSSAAVGRHRGVVNLGSGRATSVIRVARLLTRLLGADPGLIKAEASSDGAEPPGFAAVDISRAVDWFGFRPTGLRDGLTGWFGKGVR